MEYLTFDEGDIDTEEKLYEVFLKHRDYLTDMKVTCPMLASWWEIDFNSARMWKRIGLRQRVDELNEKQQAVVDRALEGLKGIKPKPKGRDYARAFAKYKIDLRNVRINLEKFSGICGCSATALSTALAKLNIPEPTPQQEILINRIKATIGDITNADDVAKAYEDWKNPLRKEGVTQPIFSQACGIDPVQFLSGIRRVRKAKRNAGEVANRKSTKTAKQKTVKTAKQKTERHSLLRRNPKTLASTSKEKRGDDAGRASASSVGRESAIQGSLEQNVPSSNTRSRRITKDTRETRARAIRKS
jgi:hypothetical protein